MMELTFNVVERPTPNVQDVFDCAYDVRLRDRYVGTYYKRAGVEEYTASSLEAGTYLSPGPCIAYILRKAFAEIDLTLEAEINYQLVYGG